VSQKLKSSLGKRVSEQGMSILNKKIGENRSNNEGMGIIPVKKAWVT
jgi:hypothetical protein